MEKNKNHGDVTLNVPTQICCVHTGCFVMNNSRLCRVEAPAAPQGTSHFEYDFKKKKRKKGLTHCQTSANH